MEAPSLSALLDVAVPAPGHHDATAFPELDAQPILHGANYDHLLAAAAEDDKQHHQERRNGEPAAVSAVAPSLSGLLDVGVPAPGCHDATELDDKPLPQGARNHLLQGEAARVSAVASLEGVAVVQVPQEQAAAAQPLQENQPKQPVQYLV